MNAWKVHLGISDCLCQKAHVVKSSIIDLFLSKGSIDVTTKELYGLLKIHYHLARIMKRLDRSRLVILVLVAQSLKLRPH